MSKASESVRNVVEQGMAPPSVRDLLEERDELLEALESFMFEFGDKADSATVRKSRAAIAKAKGE